MKALLIAALIALTSCTSNVKPETIPTDNEMLASSYVSVCANLLMGNFTREQAAQELKNQTSLDDKNLDFQCLVVEKSITFGINYEPMNGHHH